MDNRPIGVFDSGVGGLTVVNAIVKHLPRETIYYVGDTARVPYGNKSQDRIQQYSKEIVKWLIKQDCKMIVIACNTASSLAIEYLNKEFSIPIVGVIDPGVNHAISITRKPYIGVLGTHATIQSDSYGERLRSIDPQLQVICQACPLFVPLVEEGLITGDIPTLIARFYLEHFKNRDVDTVILGCTHYPILERIIRKVLGEEIKLVDSGKSTAGVVENILNENLLVSDNKKGKIYSFVTDSKNEFEKVIKKSLAQLFKIDITSTTLIDLH